MAGTTLPKLWKAFEKAFPDDQNAAFGGVVRDLHAFEHIRYPEDMIREGSVVTFSFEDSNEPPTRGEGESFDSPYYSLAVGAIDKLVHHIVSIGSLDPEIGFPVRPGAALEFLRRHNRNPIL